MLHYKANWILRVLRNAAEVSSDGGTVVIREPAQIIEVPAAPGVAETLGAAAAVIDMANAIAPVDRNDEILFELREMNRKLDGLNQGLALSLSTPPVVEVIVPETDEIEETPPAEIVVPVGEIQKEVVTEVIPANEPPKKRKRNFI